jgi:hypothetical protein
MTYRAGGLQGIEVIHGCLIFLMLEGGLRLWEMKKMMPLLMAVNKAERSVLRCCEGEGRLRSWLPPNLCLSGGGSGEYSGAFHGAEPHRAAGVVVVRLSPGGGQTEVLPGAAW